MPRLLRGIFALKMSPSPMMASTRFWIIFPFSVNKRRNHRFVGSTGSGKSSIINVFMRFYEFQSGRVLLDGVDIRDYSQAELRKNIGLVLQEPFSIMARLNPILPCIRI